MGNKQGIFLWDLSILVSRVNREELNKILVMCPTQIKQDNKVLYQYNVGTNIRSMLADVPKYHRVEIFLSDQDYKYVQKLWDWYVGDEIPRMFYSKFLGRSI